MVLSVNALRSLFSYKAGERVRYLTGDISCPQLHLRLERQAARNSGHAPTHSNSTGAALAVLLLLRAREIEQVREHLDLAEEFVVGHDFYVFERGPEQLERLPTLGICKLTFAIPDDHDTSRVYRSEIVTRLLPEAR